MRERGSGAIVQMSSMGGQLAFAGFGAYCAAKFALEGLTEALAAEVAPFGIRVLIVEPGSFRTGFAGASMHHSRELDAYADTVGATRAFMAGMDGEQPGDPAKAAAAILAALDAPEPLAARARRGRGGGDPRRARPPPRRSRRVRVRQPRGGLRLACRGQGLRGELAAGRVDVAAARQPDRRAQAVLLERGPEGVDRRRARSRRRPPVGLYGIRLTL